MAIQKIPRLQACIILFNSKKKARSYEELYERKLNEIKFVEILENCIGLDKKIVGGGMNNETTLFYYYHGPNYKSSSLEVDIYGEEGLLEMIILAQKERWQIFSKALNAVLDLHMPAKTVLNNYKYCKEIKQKAYDEYERKYKYRLATIKDVKGLKQLGLKSYGQFRGQLTTENWKQLETNLSNEQLYINLLNKSKCIICVKEKKEIVGMVFLVPSGHPTTIFQTNWSYIRMMGVAPEESGQGIGTKLIISCKKCAVAAKETVLALHTSEMMKTAMSLYEKMGFEKVKEISPQFGKRYWLYTSTWDACTTATCDF